MKRTIPLLIAAASGTVLIVSYFVPALEPLGELVTQWFNILAAVAFVLGGASLFKVQLKTISDRESGWGYSAIILLSFLATLFVGLFKVGVRPDWDAEYPGEAWQHVAAPPGLPAAEDGVRRLTPAALYRDDFAALAAERPLSDDDRAALAALSEDPEWSSAVSALAARSRAMVEVRYPVDADTSEGADRVWIQGGSLVAMGPMPAETRDALLAAPPGLDLAYGPPNEPVVETLRRLGPLSDAQAALAAAFDWGPPDAAADDAAPRAERGLDLALSLMKLGPLNADQRSLLLDPARELRAARNAVRAAFAQSQQVKFGWTNRYLAEGSAFWWCYEYLFQPLTATVFAMLAFYLSSAAFRAFRAKNLEAGLLLGTALLILVAVTPAGAWLSSLIAPDSPLAWLRVDALQATLMSVFVTAGNRAIYIGIALGIAATSLKVILGIDRSYLGKD